MWTWFSDPFGTDAANVNSSGAGSFPYNLRFPGQVFDGEAGLHANGFRDFYPAVGRYVESDPIGLAGGSYATYAYADGNPISESDPLGLDPWGGLGGGVSATEAQALSVVQAFNNWFNTPNPCFKAQLQAENPRLEPVISEFSLLDLTVGPWNTAPGGAVGGWVGYGFGTGSKVGVVNYLNYKRPGWGDTLAKWLKRGAFPVIAYSTYRHVQAAAGCGCKR
jgi:RHS repeat-associated protein